VQLLRQLQRIAVTHDMHVHGHGFGAQQVIVQRRDPDAAVLELLHHAVDLVLGHDEIAHYHRLIAGRLESEPAADCEAPGLIATPSTLTLRSVRGKLTR
jgi:hypothetical protein